MLKQKIYLHLFLFWFVFPVWADYSETVKVKVEMIVCDQPRTDLSDQNIIVHDSLRPLRDKLIGIHFKNFNLDSAQIIHAKIKEKQKLQFANQDTLELELLYLEGQRVGLWLDWHDSSGMKLLDTRMHFDSTETMLAGAECEENKGKMLAVSIITEPTQLNQ